MKNKTLTTLEIRKESIMKKLHFSMNIERFFFIYVCFTELKKHNSIATIEIKAYAC